MSLERSPASAAAMATPSPVSAAAVHVSHRRAFIGALLGVDALMLIAAFTLAYWLRFYLGITVEPDVAPQPQHYVRTVLILLPLWLLLFAVLRLYDYRMLLGGTAEYARVLEACTGGVLLVIIVSFFDLTFLISRAWLVMSWLLSAMLVASGRFLMRRVAYRLRRQGLFIAPTILVGAHEEAAALVSMLDDRAYSGVDLVGFVTTQPDEGSFLPPQLTKLGAVDDLPQLITRCQVTQLIVVSTALHRQQLLDVYQRLSSSQQVEILLSSGLYEVLTTGMEVRNAGFIPLLRLRTLRLDRIEQAMKTVLDYAVTLTVLILLSPLMLSLAVAIWLDSPGPVLYRRRVLGVGGHEFDALKFRTMAINGDEILAQHPELMAELQDNHKLKDDPRVTRVGRFLRNTSLDELPQLFNVLRGQMSLVGPRMISPAEAKEYGALRMNLHTVKPGITGLWQVSGRSDLSYEERVQLDMQYIRNYTLWQDLQILFVQTLPAVLKRRGAY